MLPFLIALTVCSAPLDLKDGDRVVLVGGALVEREQQFGCLEVTLHAMFPDRKFTVRNLGWSGDTVWGEARAGFGTQAGGYRKLVEQIKAEKPTVLILGYGASEAFAGKEGVGKFVEQYRRLLADAADAETRCLFLTIPESKAARVSPTFARQAYDEAIRSLAAERHGWAIDIGQLYQPVDSRSLTDDGILPNHLGYWKLAGLVGQSMADDARPVPDITALAANREPLRQLILRKNDLHFHQYRPQNDTYLFGFRKHEQGNNAVEIPRFGPLIAELDAKINEMKAK